MDNMDVQIAATIEKYRLIKRGDSVLVALSGGPDSVALLHLLVRFKGKYRISLAAAHLNHGIRRNSADDREFCRRLCRQLKVRFHSKRVDVDARAKREKLSVEEAGRRARYEYFEQLAEKYGYGRIATGHNVDDSVETVIFNMARGAGLAGLAGIPAVRGRIIRPLIETGKSEIVSWLDANGIEYVIDRTNLSLKYARNRIRHRIMPQLGKINKSAAGNISRLSRNIAREMQLIDSVISSAYEKCRVKSGKGKIVLDLEILNDYHEKLKEKVVIEAYRRLSGRYYRLSSEASGRTEAILAGRSGARSPLGRGIWIEKSKRTISLFRYSEKRGPVELEIPGTTTIPFSELIIRSAILSRSEVRNLKTDPDRAYLDLALINGCFVRFWKKGDRMRPFGMRGRRLLSDIFTDRGIPAHHRREIPLLEADGRIAWIAGVMISDDFKVGPGTRQILSLSLCEL
jgi:tRNA(Ile)-lysidine synthase